MFDFFAEKATKQLKVRAKGAFNKRKQQKRQANSIQKNLHYKPSSLRREFLILVSYFDFIVYVTHVVNKSLETI